MKVVIIKYNSGNIQSVKFALQRLGIEPIVSDSESEIRSADKVVFPGVGQADSAMSFLKNNGLDQIIPSLNQPLLGICLGMQLLCRHSEEGNTKCLGVFDQTVKKFSANAKVPQVGWNTIYDLKGALFKGVTADEYQYFVHSYYVETNENTIAATNYITKFSSAIQKNNFYGVQFHPEKSAKAGEQILKNFIELC